MPATSAAVPNATKFTNTIARFVLAAGTAKGLWMDFQRFTDIAPNHSSAPAKRVHVSICAGVEESGGGGGGGGGERVGKVNTRLCVVPLDTTANAHAHLHAPHQCTMCQAHTVSAAKQHGVSRAGRGTATLDMWAGNRPPPPTHQSNNTEMQRSMGCRRSCPWPGCPGLGGA